MTGTAAEVLGQGAEPVARSRTALAGYALLAAVVLALALRAGDARLASRESGQLLDRATASQQAIAYADGRIGSTVMYTSPTLGAAGTPPRVGASLARLVQESAAGQLSDVRAERTATARTRVLPWHDRQRAARAASLDYLDIRLAYFTAVSDSVDELYVRHPELLAAQTAQRDALRTAATNRRQRARVEAVLPGLG